MNPSLPLRPADDQPSGPSGRYLGHALAQARISIRGARTHNLKNIDPDFPRNHLMVITGLSVSCKSNLEFAT